MLRNRLHKGRPFTLIDREVLTSVMKRHGGRFGKSAYFCRRKSHPEGISMESIKGLASRVRILGGLFGKHGNADVQRVLAQNRHKIVTDW